MEFTVFHCSSQSGMKVISPRPSTHGTPYVYATKDPVLSLVFVVNRAKNFGDFSLWIGRDQSGKVCLCERYGDAFTDSYFGVSGAQYVLPANTFLENQTSWSEEVVSRSPVVPVAEIPLEDMEQVLSQNIQMGKIAFYPYPNRPALIPQDDEDLIFKAIVYSNATLGSPVLDRFKSLHPRQYSKACAILENPSLRRNHLEKWCKLFGKNYALDAYQKTFPQDSLTSDPVRSSQESAAQRGPSAQKDGNGPLATKHREEKKSRPPSRPRNAPIPQKPLEHPE